MRTLPLFGALLFALRAVAAPDEIQVYTEELDAPGAFGLEQHLNYSIRGQQTPAYPGQMAPNHVAQVTPEFSYGLTDTLEAGLYVPFAFTPAGDAFLNGLRARLKYIAPRARGDEFFYGVNVEVGRDSQRISDSISGLELRPIVGYRDRRWLVSFNPVLTMGLAANVSHEPQFEPSLKLTHRIGAAVRAGIEYYGVYGPLGHPLPPSQREHALYAVADIESGEWDVNCGIGRGFANAPDTWVLKAIVAVPLR